MSRILRPTGMRSFRPFNGAGGEFTSIAGGGGGGYEDTITVDNPLVWYKMDDASGNITDTQSYIDLVPAGTATYSEPALIADGGTAISFDGSTDYFANYHPDSSMNNLQFTLEFAHSIPDYTSNYSIMGCGDQGVAAAAGWTIRTADTTGYWVLEWYTGSWHTLHATVGAGIDDPAWYSHVVDWTNQDWTIYKNGVQVYQNLAIGFGQPTGGGYYSDELTIGARRYNAGILTPFKGTLDQIVYFTSDIGATRIAAHAAGMGF